MIEQAYPSRGDSRVMKPGCVAFDYMEPISQPTWVAPRLGRDGSFLITGGEPSRAFDRLVVHRIEFHGRLRAAAPNASEAEDGSVLACHRPRHAQ